MRANFPLLASLVLLGAGLTGCLGSDEPAPVDPQAQAFDANASTNVTNDDGSDEAAMAGDVGHMPHLHDYWKDRERVTLMDEDVTVDAPTAAFFTFFNTFRGTPGAGGAFLQLPDGQIVYEGTGQLEFTATWTDATVTGMAVSYRTPAEAQFSDAQPLTSGTPLVLEIAPEQTDMPHAKTSRWQFLVTPAQAGQVIAGKFHVKVDIVRLRDVEVFPGHPELFGGEHSLTLFSGAASANQDNVAMRFVTAIQNQGQQQDTGIASEKVVPMETRSMTANITIKSASADVGKAARPYFFAKPADRNGYGCVRPVLVDEATQTYQVAWLVEMQQTDSPYATESDWKFDLFYTSETVEGVESGLGGVQVEYDLEVVAYDDVVEDVQELSFGRGC